MKVESEKSPQNEKSGKMKPYSHVYKMNNNPQQMSTSIRYIYKRKNAESQIFINLFKKKSSTNNIKPSINHDQRSKDQSVLNDTEFSENKNIFFNFFDSYVYKKMNLSIRLTQQIKAAKQLGVLLAAFILAWIPYFVIFIVVAFCSDCVSDSVFLLTVWLGYINSSINPLLYGLCNSGFRSAFKKIFKISTLKQKNRNELEKIIFLSINNNESNAAKKAKKNENL